MYGFFPQVNKATREPILQKTLDKESNRRKVWNVTHASKEGRRKSFPYIPVPGRK